MRKSAEKARAADEYFRAVQTSQVCLLAACWGFLAHHAAARRAAARSLTR